MAGLAKRLQIAWCKEQFTVALVGLDVVSHSSCSHVALLLAELAQRLNTELVEP